MNKKPYVKSSLTFAIVTALAFSGFPVVAMAEAMATPQEGIVEAAESNIDEAMPEQLEETYDQTLAETDVPEEQEQSCEDEVIATTPEEDQSLPVEAETEVELETVNEQEGEAESTEQDDESKQDSEANTEEADLDSEANTEEAGLDKEDPEAASKPEEQMDEDVEQPSESDALTAQTSKNISFGITYSGYLATRTTDYYYFTTPSSGRVTINATYYFKYGRLEVYEATTGTKLEGFDVEWNSELNRGVANDYVDLTKGSYYFKVYPSFSGYPGSYNLKATFASANETFSETNEGIDNDAYSANKISLGKQYKGQVAVNDRMDCYLFELPIDGRITVSATLNFNLTRVELYERNSGKHIKTFNADWNKELKRSTVKGSIDLTAGTYYVKITAAFSGYTGPYAFRITSIGFSDVPASHWGYEPIIGSVTAGLMSGYSGNKAGTFGPEDKLTRGQVAVMLWNMAGKPSASSSAKNFSDVRKGAYYYNAVRWAASRGVVNGYSGNKKGKFGPNDNVTREQLAVMIANYAKSIRGIDVSGRANYYSHMSDKASVSKYAEVAMGWCFRAHILPERKDVTKIRPKANATRAETASMMWNLYNY